MEPEQAVLQSVESVVVRQEMDKNQKERVDKQQTQKRNQYEAEKEMLTHQKSDDY